MKLFEPRGGMPTERRQAHFPGRAPIEAYGNGGFRFAGMSHRGSILCLPSGIFGWDVDEAGAIDVDSLARVLGEAAETGIVLIGTGADLRRLPQAVTAALRAAGLGVDVMSTGAAARIYNVMLGENRKVGAALLAVP